MYGGGYNRLAILMRASYASMEISQTVCIYLSVGCRILDMLSLVHQDSVFLLAMKWLCHCWQLCSEQETGRTPLLLHAISSQKPQLCFIPEHLNYRAVQPWESHLMLTGRWVWWESL